MSKILIFRCEAYKVCLIVGNVFLIAFSMQKKRYNRLPTAELLIIYLSAASFLHAIFISIYNSWIMPTINAYLMNQTI
jgi:hypothetical protein